MVTPLGVLAVYGTIIGTTGNRGGSFNADLKSQLRDFERISESTDLCIAGDLNMSFSDNYYFTEEGRNKLKNTFDKLGLKILTADINNNIDHIILARNFVGNKTLNQTVWNEPSDRATRLSDHISVMVEIQWQVSQSRRS